ncbi:MAG: hypothetical protein K2J48_01725 [Muribaculaceae bacterium]|nr:hypothetical protein [Muribaculaceae bacterium]
MKQENKKFIEWFESLFPHEKKFYKYEIMLRCEISPVTFNTWLKGNCYIKNPYRIVINAVAGKKLFDTIILASQVENVNL